MSASKECVKDLCIFSGSPAFARKLHVGRPNIGNREKLLARVNEILDNAWLTNNGPFVQEFKRRIEDALGVKHCIPMCNGTVALEIAVRALDLTGEVIVPSFTFVATAHALQWQQITPVFCDVDARTHNINPGRIESMITPRTTGILGVHLWGRPCDVEALSDIARRRRLKLLFDAAHAFGCSHRGRMIGNFGDAEVLSFHATKFFNTFEGGAVVTNDDELAAKMLLMNNFGFAGYDRVIYIGTNGKLSEVAAAMGLTGLESLDEFVEVNRRSHKIYQQELTDVPGIDLLTYNQTERNNFQYVVLEIDERSLGLSRDDVVALLWAENVLARRYFYPGCHRMEPYRSLFPHAGLLLPETERLTGRVVILPTGTGVTEEEIRVICRILRLAAMNSSEVRRGLMRHGETARGATEPRRASRQEAGGKHD